MDEESVSTESNICPFLYQALEECDLLRVEKCRYRIHAEWASIIEKCEVILL